MTENVQTNSPEMENIQSMLVQLKKFEQKEEAQQQKMDQLINRCSALQQLWTWGSMPGLGGGYNPSALAGLPPGALSGVGLPGTGPGASAGATAKKAKQKGK